MTRRMRPPARHVAAIGLALCTAIATAACSSSTGDGMASTGTSGATGSSATSSRPSGSTVGTAAPVGELGELQLRPVLMMLAPQPDAAPEPGLPGTSVLEDETGLRYLVADPQVATPVEQATAQVDQVGEWTVEVTFTPDGLSALNELAAMCFAHDATCPTGQLAIVIDDTVISAPSIQASSLSNPVAIYGTFDEAGARRLAALIRTAG